MRLDKYLKVSRIIKRRTVANDACSGGRVSLNGKVAKPGAEVKVGDVMTIRFGDRYGKYEILSIAETVRKEGAAEMYRILSEDEGMAEERG
jgi:ribosomal 50S subunit-recycling heat shock protein